LWINNLDASHSPVLTRPEFIEGACRRERSEQQKNAIVPAAAYSSRAQAQVPSVLASLTSEFEMGSGVASPLCHQNNGVFIDIAKFSIINLQFSINK
jgi:hypothetical protein